MKSIEIESIAERRSEMSERTKTTNWQQWSAWMAGTGYSELTHSAVMTLQAMHRAEREATRQTPATVYAAALELERSWMVAEIVELPLLMVAAGEELAA
jgi:hypothetical protein